MATACPSSRSSAAHFPGVNNTTVWSDPAAGSQIEFDSFVHLARTAERGKFDFFFLAEGLRLREQRGQIHDLDVVGRPDTLTVLAALAAVTDHLGLAGTLNATFNEPYELARQLATLDHLSGGRAAWNVVTSLRRVHRRELPPRRLPRPRRPLRARRRVRPGRAGAVGLVGGDEIVADPASRRFVAAGSRRGLSTTTDEQFDIAGHFTVPRSPQGHPVILQAGDSDGGRELAAHSADAIFTRHCTLDAGQAFYADVKAPPGPVRPAPDELKILPGQPSCSATPRARPRNTRAHIRRQQVSPQTAILLLEQVWNRDLSALRRRRAAARRSTPTRTPTSIIQGRARMYDDPLATAASGGRWPRSRRLASAT